MNHTVPRYAVIGSGDFSVEVVSYLSDLHQVSNMVCTIWDDHFNPLMFDNLDCGYGGNLEEICVTKYDKVLICIGSCKRRIEISEFLKVRGIKLGNFIHPSAVIASSADIQDGCIILPHTCVSAQAIVGYNTVVNSHVAVGHHVNIGDHCVVSPQVLIAGRASIGSETFVGAGAIITQGKNIGIRSKISAGSVIYKHAPANAFLFGNPAKNFAKG